MAGFYYIKKGEIKKVEYNSFPKRKVRHKKEETAEWYGAAFAAGLIWVYFSLIPDTWKNVWASLFVVIIDIWLTSKFTNLKIPLILKWSIALILYIIGFVVQFVIGS